ncbi:hypothetical protein AS189_09300 [Arthrobacter alpinus]|uniref:Uncharacterized protein n=1 Tax=Arthrobacter alpinus TaxID=656366 RepID=A0A0S2LYL4_9MICC|nr:hypothetical protein [Arthrobacter alpinus]ALO66650.1 hypothetical protein AS189_09300 [Arthrobacter alpinus]
MLQGTYPHKSGVKQSRGSPILIGKGGEIMLSPLYDTAPTFLLFEATTNAGHALDGQSSLTKLTLEHVILEGVAWGLNHEDARETAVAVLESAAEAAATQPAHAQAAELEPLSTRVTFLDPPGTEMYESVKLWREWGVPFTDASARTVQSGGPFAGEVNEESLLSVMLAEGSRRPDLLLRVVDTDGATKISIPLTGVTATSGASTGWMRLHATTPAQLLTFELRDDKNGKNPKVNFAVGNVDGNDPADVLAEIELISSIDPADSFFIEMMTGAQMLKGGGLTTPSSLLTHYRPVAAGLVSLQASATMNLVMPDIMEMLLGQFARFESFVAIYGGKAHIGKWQEISMTIPEDATPEQIEAAKSEIRAVSRGEHSPVAIEQPTISLADRSFVLARPIVTSRVSFTPVDDAVIDALGPGGTVVVTPGADDSVITAAVAGWTPDTQIRDLPLNPEVP